MTETARGLAIREPGPGWGVGTFFTSRGWEVEVRTRARWVLGRICESMLMIFLIELRFWW